MSVLDQQKFSTRPHHESATGVPRHLVLSYNILRATLEHEPVLGGTLPSELLAKVSDDEFNRLLGRVGVDSQSAG